MSNTPKTSEVDEQAMPSATHAKNPPQNPKQATSEADPGALPSNTEKDPDDWTTGGETMTGAQASYLKTLSEEAGVPFDDTLSKAEASKQIDALQAKTGRGRNH
jgi:hypothetical protein